MTLVGDTRGVGRPIDKLDQTAASETVRFENMLHGLIVRMRIGTHITIMGQRPTNAVAGRMTRQTGRRYAMNRHIAVIIQPSTIDMRICRILTKRCV